MGGRGSVRSAMAAAAVVAGAALSGTGAADAGQVEGVNQTMRASYGSMITVDKGDRLTPFRPSATHQILSPSGRVLSSRSLESAPTRVAVRRDLEPGDCEPSRQRRGFKYLGETSRAADNPAYYIRFKYFMYKQSKARKRGESQRKYTKQLEICSAGGASSKGGNRLDNVITIVSLRTQWDRLIRMKWDSGEDESQADASLTFKVGKGPVAISGTIPVNAQDKLTGRQGHHKGATPALFKRFKYNQVNAEWDGRSGPNFYAGSTGFQGNVGHALWELAEGAKTPKFIVEAVLYYHCGHPTAGPLPDCKKP